ncbi:MAG: hypothetical protein Tsb0020_11940 [Haliangiales bacterium]
MLKWAAVTAVVLIGLYFSYGLYVSGHAVLGASLLAAVGLAAFVYSSSRASVYRYLFPGLAGMAVFVVLPLVYTIGLGFTKYRSGNFLTYEEATKRLLQETYEVEDGERYRATLHRDGDGFRLVLQAQATPAAQPADEDGSLFDEDEGEDEGSIFDDDEGEDEGSIFDDDEGEDEGSIFDDDGSEDSIFDDDDDSGEGSEGGAGAGEEDSIFDDDGSEDSIFDDDGGEGGADGAGAGEEDSIFNDDDGNDDGDDDGSEDSDGADDGAVAAAPAGQRFVSDQLSLDYTSETSFEMQPLAEVSGLELGEPLPISALIERTEALRNLRATFPDGSWVVKDKNSFDLFLAQKNLYTQGPDGTLLNQRTGATLTPNFDTGFYETEAGEQVIPGFRIFVGLDQFARLFQDERIQGPFFRIFAWTVIFAGLTVLFTLIVGLVLAEILSWEALRFRGVYRMLLFMPYAIPGFISILVFKGLFNTASGEINTILGLLIGIRPDWFGDPFLAKSMILVVNTWLGYPYIMLLCMGLQKSIPSDLYEASALAGAGPLTNFFKITWPLIRRPLTPLLISSFAFNFNNFVLIFLLTGGRPDFLDTSTSAGETDILVSYTFRVAFQDSGTNYGLAAAISALVFILVAALSVVNLKLTNVNKDEKR